MRGEKERIRDQIEQAFGGDPWCGPSLMTVLRDVSAAQASTRVPGLAHTIGEIVLHVAAWQGAVAQRIAGTPVAGPGEGDWPAFDPREAGAWDRALHRLEGSHRHLLGALDAFDTDRLDQGVGDGSDPRVGGGATAYVTLQGVAQHALYHAGQIVLLKKLAAVA